MILKVMRRQNQSRRITIGCEPRTKSVECHCQSPGRGLPMIITLKPHSGNKATINTAPNKKVPMHSATTVKIASESHTWDNGDSSATRCNKKSCDEERRGRYASCARKQCHSNVEMMNIGIIMGKEKFCSHPYAYLLESFC